MRHRKDDEQNDGKDSERTKNRLYTEKLSRLVQLMLCPKSSTPSRNKSDFGIRLVVTNLELECEYQNVGRSLRRDKGRMGSSSITKSVLCSI